jgi:hypothetical protein
MAAFGMMCANIHQYAFAVIRSASSLAGEKGQFRQFFAQQDSVQECSIPQF